MHTGGTFNKRKEGDNVSIESRSNQYGTVFDHWQIQELIGPGSGGKTAVFLLKRNDAFQDFSAMKVVNLIEERGRYEDLPAYRKKEYDDALKECKAKAIPEVQMMLDLRGNTNVVDYLDHKFHSWSDSSGFGCDLLIRMELLEDLRKVIRSGRTFTESEILKVGRDIATALFLCHSNGIVHRDIKPENIFVNKKGDFKLGDFGISRILGTSPNVMASTGVGTPEYAAPEQFFGHHDKRVDIYSLGLVLYELCNRNRLPFATSSYVRPEDVERRRMGTPLPKPEGINAGLWSVIQKACAHKVADRYGTAQEFLEALCRLDGTKASKPPKPVIISQHSNLTGKATSKQDNYSTLPALADFDRLNALSARLADTHRTPTGQNSRKANRKKTPLTKAMIVLSILLLTATIVTGYIFYQRSIETIQASYSGEMVFVGEPINYDNLSVLGICHNGNQIELGDFTITPNELTLEGANKITISANGHECTVEITAYRIDHITAAYSEELLSVGSELDRNKISVTGVCTDGTEIPISDYTADLSQVLLPGHNQIPIHYDNLETVLTVNVEKPAVQISFDPNGGECSESARTVVYGDKIGSLPMLENIEGYTFTGWAKDGTIIPDDAVIIETEDITLVALWEPNKYTVTYHNHDESYVQDFVYGQAKSLSANKFANSIFRFVGWAASPDSEQIKYKNNERVSDLTATNNGNIDLYAVWQLDNALLLKDLVNDSGTTNIYETTTNGFEMFGNTYAGFTVGLGAWFNLWGRGTQYCVFNISDWATVGDTLKMTFGHVDGTDNGSLQISICFDGSDNATYVFEYDLTNPPKTVDIDIASHESMKIIVDNMSQTMPRVGFSFISIT